uniref:C3orf38 homolog n=1 Tax=Caligus rogercresseyi TaxID=217165 RepID=C1BNK2_CALRO|nr:C3orf38 homolog [Caligus rogercresseyi]
MLHTESAVDLLKRRKIKRDLLFKYLSSKKVPVEGSADKSILVSLVLESWGTSERPSGFIDEESLPEAPAPSRNTSYTSLSSLDPGLCLHSALSSRVASSGVRGIDSGEDSLSLGGCMDHEDTGSAPTNFRDAFSSLPTHNTLSSSCFSVPPSLSSSESQAQEMAKTFTSWFYDLLNELKDFGPQHFWVDASAKISVLRDGSSTPEDFSAVENGSEVSSAIQNIVLKYGIRFNPNNCPEGVSGVMDPHGLVVIRVCGTLHNAANCCGVFHQRFGLIRDPLCSNAWKIKFTEASLVSKNVVHELPQLTQIETLAAVARS